MGDGVTPTPRDEAATTKLWGVYVSEAEKYDKALVESWRGDMEGMLIFAGLFSASLTAFLIESYKTLNPDPADTTVVLLTQILAQLGDSNLTHVPSSSPAFIPPTTSLICNAFWFLSLGLSLSCALVATLVEQWSREFLHKTNMNSDPVTRARVLSFLYYGLKRFNMHAVVEVIPLLLHSSLFFFLAGLVAFLLPVNLAMTVVAAFPLLLIGALYIYLTILPIFQLDCPYRTPLSGVAWRLLKSAASAKSVLNAIILSATEPSARRTDRDKKALIWTLGSLKNDHQLEVFLEAIPEIVWSPKGRRRIHDHYIHTLAAGSDMALASRMRTLLASCDSGLLSAEAATRRQITYYKALWTIASLSISGNAWTPSQEDVVLFDRVHDAPVAHHIVSARALAAWLSFCSFRTPVLEAMETLDVVSSREKLVVHLKNTERHPVFSFLPARFRARWALHVRKLSNRSSALPVGDLVQSVLQKLRAFRAEIPLVILFDYLKQAAALDSSPYQFEHTISTLQLEDVPLSTAALSHLHPIFSDIVTQHLTTMNSTTELHRIDSILGMLVSFSHRAATAVPTIPDAMVRYLNRRTSDAAVEHVYWKCGAKYLWSCITAGLANDRYPDDGESPENVSMDDLLAALWRLCVLPRQAVIDLSTCDAALEVINSRAGTSPVSLSLIPLVKLKIYDALRFNHHTARTPRSALAQQLQHPALPTESATPIPPTLALDGLDDDTIDAQLDPLYAVLSARIAEGRVQLLASVLEACHATGVPPYDPVKTLSVLGAFAPVAPVHARHQLRFAASLQPLLSLPLARRRPGLLRAVLNSELFDVYATCGETEAAGTRTVSGWQLRHWPWLDEPAAREGVSRFLVGCEVVFRGAAGTDAAALGERVECILDGLDYLHREATVEMSTSK
ncbi:hypothetical protein C8R46DRAFT_1344293 [Mycena filopes]|nr:hypothetical protein C8R46DRAFT_1344293 [Mycena filopes]